MLRTVKLSALAAALAVSLISGAGAANATHSNGEGPKQDLVSGTGQFQGQAGIDLELHVNATSGPSGEDARGHFFTRRSGVGSIGPLDFRGRVICLTVFGNRATVFGVITRSEDEALEGTAVQMFVEDNGEPGDADRFEGRLGDPLSAECVSTIRNVGATAEQGNFVVHDAAPQRGHRTS